MIEVKGGMLTDNFELLRNTNKSSVNLTKAPHLEDEFNSELGGSAYLD